jgi:acetyl-CoA acetyltransferase
MMADPLTKLHCCIRSDGGGAVVLTSEERARDLPKAPIWILGTGETTDHTTMSEWEDFTVSPALRSGQLAFERAGVNPSEIDLCQIYDAFTPMVLLTFEALGFCGKGEGGPFVEDGKMRVGGALPTNTDGGGLSHCHPGMRGMFLLVEAVRQMRREAHGRQVEKADLCCVHGTGGWFSSASTVILGTTPH